MKLATKLGISAIGIAMSFASFGAQSAQAVGINFLGQSGNTYNFGLSLADSENLGAGTTWDVYVNAPLASAAAVNSTALQALGVTSFSVGDSDINFGSFKALYQVNTTGGFENLDDFKFSLTTTAGNPITSFAAKFKVVPAVFVLQPEDLPSVPETPIEDIVIEIPETSVPEPMTVGGSLLAVGFAAWMKRKKAVSA